MTLDSSGDLWVTYSWDNKIGEFNNEGKFYSKPGAMRAQGPGELFRTHTVSPVGSEGDIWVSEYGNNRVQVFTPAGEYLYGFGSKGNGTGQFNEAPHGLAFSGSYVYVLDSGIWWENTGNSRIEKWTQAHRTTKTSTSTTHKLSTILQPRTVNTQNAAMHPEWASMPCQTQPATQPP